VPSLDTEGYRAVASHQGWLWTYTMNIFVSFHGKIGQDPFEGGGFKVLHFWSLAVEEQFYLVWPMIVLLTTRRQLRWTCGAMFVGAWALRFWLSARGNLAAPYFFTLCRVDDLAVGAFIAAMAREKDGLEKLRACAQWVAIVALWALLGTAMHIRHFFQLEPFVERYAYSAFSALYGAMLVFALTAKPWNWYRVAIENPVFRSYGKYSYAIYIFHWLLFDQLFNRIAPLEKLADTLGTPDAALTARFLIVAAVSWAVGFVSWHAYEKHFLKLKRAFYTNPKSSPTDFTD
jgi:peptidoglycan/LPS O-acetylase OafA/YrhL